MFGLPISWRDRYPVGVLVGIGGALAGMMLSDKYVFPLAADSSPLFIWGVVAPAAAALIVGLPIFGMTLMGHLIPTTFTDGSRAIRSTN